jgi:hypothetical protein
MQRSDPACPEMMTGRFDNYRAAKATPCCPDLGRWQSIGAIVRRSLRSLTCPYFPVNDPRHPDPALRAGRGSWRLCGPHWRTSRTVARSGRAGRPARHMPRLRFIQLAGFDPLPPGVGAQARPPDVDHRRRARGERDRPPDQAQTIQGLLISCIGAALGLGIIVAAFVSRD